ncbi:MAG: hypothetical protein LC437_01860 [Thiohalomonas sp.]|nr:hypothetical protein [Thiohalomonas sp.]
MKIKHFHRSWVYATFITTQKRDKRATKTENFIVSKALNAQSLNISLI